MTQRRKNDLNMKKDVFTGQQSCFQFRSARLVKLKLLQKQKQPEDSGTEDIKVLLLDDVSLELNRFHLFFIFFSFNFGFIFLF